MTERHAPDPKDGSDPEAAARHAKLRARSREMLLPRLLVSLISLTLIGLGLMAVVTQSYYGRSSKMGGAEVSLNGTPAVAMGLFTVFLGLLPLALWFPGKRSALAWALACICAAAMALYVSSHGAKP